jgi:hypothetical protein
MTAAAPDAIPLDVRRSIVGRVWDEMDKDETEMSKTASMHRADQWLAEMHENAAAAGQKVDDRTVALFEHIGICRSCHLRQNNDPELCSVAEDILDGGEGR